MRTGQVVNLAPDGTDIGSSTTIETLALIEDAATHSVLLNVVVVAVDERHLLGELVGIHLGVSLGVSHLELLAYSLESLGTSVLVAVTLSSDSVGLVVASSLHLGAELLVVHLVAVFALHG